MSPSSRIRSLEDKITALQKKQYRYENRLDILEDTLVMGTERAWPYEFVPGVDREKKQRDIATLQGKLTRVKSDIEKLENDIEAIRQGDSGSSRRFWR
jgi:predicted RNase H-like nuclease (RuvC/YqgF family)